MSTQKPSLDNFTDDLTLYGEILSYTGLCSSFARTCKNLRGIHDRIMTHKAEHFIDTVDRTLWNPPGLPQTRAKLTPEAGRAILSAAAEKVKASRERLSEDEKKLFQGKSPATIATIPELFHTILRIADEAKFVEFVELVRRHLPLYCQSFVIESAGNKV